MGGRWNSPKDRLVGPRDRFMAYKWVVILPNLVGGFNPSEKY